ncbi:MAG: hypothetical protein DDG58_06010 [Ardenticatenia bacterium]|jgi:small conductance mechanosensitive channel|nr:MAG: hypothetical protein DDG58_06010 [Ardenticatenia bacterium]
MTDNILFAALRVCITLLIGLGGGALLRLGLRDLERHLAASAMNQERAKRLTTFIHAGRSAGYLLITLVVISIILRELGLDITPILASAGIVGLAFSLGAQTLIRDWLTGIILVLENHFAIGDVISVGEFTGTVEHITLRATYLRDSDGQLHLIPNGDIRAISNLTARWAQAVITLNFDFATDIAMVKQALEEAIRRLQADETVASNILGTPSYLAWSGLTDWSVQAQLVCKTLPGQQWAVARVLRQAALDCLREAGIRPAVPCQWLAAASTEGD